MKRLLITGSSGFLGGRAVRFYRDKYDIYAPSHREMDITDEEKVREVFAAWRPQLVLHCAAVSDVGACGREPDRSRRINVDGSRNIALAAAFVHARCLICSSDQVYFGSGRPGPHRETEKLSPANVYGSQKKRAEEECLAVNPACVLLRLSWMYDVRTENAGEHGDFFRTLAAGLRAGEILRYPVHDIRGITDVREVLRNLDKAFLLEGGIYNFGSPNDKSTYKTVADVFTALGWDAWRVEKNREAFAASPRNISMDQTKTGESGIVFLPTAEALFGNLLRMTETGDFRTVSGS